MYRRSSRTPLFDWKDKVRDFIVTTDLNDDGSVKTDKEGNEKRSFQRAGRRRLDFTEKKTSRTLINLAKPLVHTSTTLYCKNPKQKIKGKLVRTIEHQIYKDELKQILKKQRDFHPELQSEVWPQ